MKGWCERGDLNPYGFPHWILSLAALLRKIRFLAAGRRTVQEKARFREVFLGLKVSSGMAGKGRCSSVRMPVEYMAPLLPCGLKSHFQKDLLHCFEVNNGKAGHIETSICWRPTKRGSSSVSSPSSWIHNSRTSLRFF